MGACARYFFGRSHCEHKCDEEYLEDLKESFFEANLRFLAGRAPKYAKQTFDRMLKNVYFPREPQEGKE